MDECMNTNVANRIGKVFTSAYAKIPILVLALLSGSIKADSLFVYDIVSTLGYIQHLLTQIGPILSAVLFITAGIFYALGQLFPPYKRADFHTAAVDIIIGAVIVAVLSLAATGLALAAAHLLTNFTVSNST